LVENCLATYQLLSRRILQNKFLGTLANACMHLLNYVLSCYLCAAYIVCLSYTTRRPDSKEDEKECKLQCSQRRMITRTLIPRVRVYAKKRNSMLYSHAAGLQVSISFNFFKCQCVPNQLDWKTPKCLGTHQLGPLI